MPKLTWLAAAAAVAVAGAAVALPARAEGDPAKGEKEFAKCKTCHMIADGDNVIVKGGKVGPNLFGIIGRTAGTLEGFKYGESIVAAGQAGLVWDQEKIAVYTKDPKAFLVEVTGDKGAVSKMAFKLAKNNEDVAAYLATFAAPATN
jgi:cytochrome c